MKNGFEWRFVLPVIAVAMIGLIGPNAASAGWSPATPSPGFSGSRPNDLTSLSLEDGRKFLYWTRDVGGFKTVQAMRVAANGTPGPIMNISDPSADYGGDLQAVLAEDNEATVAWIAPGTPNEVVKSVDVPPAGSPGPIVNRSPAGLPDQDIGQLSIAVSPNGTVAFTWRRLNGLIWSTQAMTVPDDGPAGMLRNFSAFPDNVVNPVIAALPDNTFKLAWAFTDLRINLYNIVSVNLQNNGTVVPGDRTFVFPHEKEKLGADGLPVLDSAGNPVMEPTGATGYPHDLNMGTNAEGAAILVWRRFTIETAVNQGNTVVLGAQWGAESTRIEADGVMGEMARLTPLNANISNIHLQVTPDRRNTATWLSETGGVSKTQFFRFDGGGIWNLSTGSTFTDPSVSVSADGSMLVGWTEAGLLLGGSVVKVAQFNPNSDFVPPVLPGLDALKSSSEPLPEAGDLGLASVTFYGVDQSDIGGFWKSSFTDPGISLQPGVLGFGRGLLGIRNSQRRAFVSNPGSTPSQVTSINLSGEDASSFALLNPAKCVIRNSPGQFCEMNLTFAPRSLGVKQARLEIQSEAGTVSTVVRGEAVPGTRVSLRVKPRNRKVHAGKRVTFRAIVKNTAGMRANGVRVCYEGDRYLLKPRSKCRRIGPLAIGASRSVKISTRVRPNTKAGKQRIIVRMRAGNAMERRVPVVLRVMKRRG